jgi:hypothetical protein
MAKSNNWTVKDLQDKNLVEHNGKFVNVKTLVDPKPDKLKAFQEKQKENIEAWNAKHPVLGTPKENRKILNAVKVEQNGIRFDSRLELYAYNALKAAGIDFEFQKVFVLQDKFKYGTEAIRAITSRVDFWIPSKTLIVDTKGYANDVAPLKYKLLKKKLHDNFTLGFYEILPRIEQPKNKKEVDLLINRILYEL